MAIKNPRRCEVCQYAWRCRSGYAWIVLCPKCRVSGYHLPRPEEVGRKRGKPKGTLGGGRPTYNSDTYLEAFWAKVNKNGPVPKHCPELGPCWEWTASKYLGYGMVGFEGKVHRAHRVAWKLEHGRWPTPCGLHKCDNPACVRSSHVFEGTKQDNNLDKKLKGRLPIGSKHGQSKLTEKQVIEIRGLFASGEFTQIELGQRFGVSSATIRNIALSKTWKHVAHPDSKSTNNFMEETCPTSVQ